tara:strand:- start:187 stop:1284 length:1098 start_codon:yes stop_codon:yes gene_type:complete
MKEAQPLTQGKNLTNFEDKFKDYLGCNHAFAVCNAASALEISAQLCQFCEGDEVIIPSHTYTASAYPYIKKGAKIVWCDIDKDTRVVNAKTIEKCLSSKTKAIVVVHLYGFLADMSEIMSLAKENDLIVIEDAAQAIGTEREGIKAGNFGDIGIFSFQSHKNITTLGEGGMITIKDDQMASLLPLLRHNGHEAFEEQTDYWIPAMSNVVLPEFNGLPLMPNNFCLGEVESALGSLLLDRVDEINKNKKQRAISFIDAFSNNLPISFHKEESSRHNYHLLVAEITNGKRDSFIKKMASEHGIQCVVQYYPLNRYDLYKKLGYGEASCPNADNFYDNMVSFPFHSSLSNEELNMVKESSLRVLESLA